MNRGQFEDLFRELKGLDPDTPIWDTETTIQVFSATESSADASQLGALFNGYNTNTLIVGSAAPLRYIQPEDVVRIEMTCTYWDGFLNLHRNRETVEIPLNRLRLETYHDYYVEYYVDSGTAAQTYYDVTFLLNGGEGEDFVMSVRENSTVSEPPEPVRSGYTFLGWFADGSETKFDFTTPITGDITLTAKWQLDEPAAETHDAWFFIRTDGVIPIETGSTQYDSEYYKPAHDNSGQGALTGTVDGVAAWTTFYGTIENGAINGEKLSKAFAQVAEHIKEAPGTDAIEAALGQDFNPDTQDVVWYVVKDKSDDQSEDSACPGWHVDGVVYTKGEGTTDVRILNYYRNVDADESPIAFSVHGLGTIATVSDGIIPTREGYEFTGWNTAADGSGTPYQAGMSITMTKDVNLYAQWKLKETEPDPQPDIYTVTYKYEGDMPTGYTAPKDETAYKAGDTVTVSTEPVTIPEGYTFSGWKADGITITDGKFTMPEGNVTLTGTWTYTDPGSNPGPSYDYYRVTVNYLDRADGSKIAESYTTPSRIEGSRYDVSAYDAVAIEGYTYDATEGDAVSGILNGNKTVNVYYTADETDIDDGQTPTTDLPDTGGNGGSGAAGTDGGSVTDIPDAGTPTGSLPQTGTLAQTSAARLALTASLTAAGLALLLIRRSRKA